MYAIIHGYQMPGLDHAQKPFLHLTTDKGLYHKNVADLQSDIDHGGGGILYFHGEIDNVEMDKFWIMPFDK
jgi:hypothetical protein